jgi:MoaA/NifB/PqqE/SkfB family radical SAM enzyme
MPKRVCVVTNGTFPLKRYDGLYFYWVSLDGTEEVHDCIRGKGAHAKTKKISLIIQVALADMASLHGRIYGSQ